MQLQTHGPPLLHAVVENAEVEENSVTAVCHDSGAEGFVPGAEIAGLQDDPGSGVGGDESGGEVDAGVVRDGLGWNCF